MIIANTGAGGNSREFMRNVTSVANRVHQMLNGKIKCRGKTFPNDTKGKERGMGKAKDLTIGRLLIETESRSAQERSQIDQNIAFAAARNYTSNAEQKTIIKGWRGNGSEEFKKKRAETIVQSVAETVGLTGPEVTMHGQNPPVRKTSGKLIVGAARAGRTVEDPEISPSGPHAAGRMPILRFPKPHSEKPLAGEIRPQAKKGISQGGKDEKGNGKGKKENAGKSTPRKSSSPM